jgi:hypothetical protein
VQQKSRGDRQTEDQEHGDANERDPTPPENDAGDGEQPANSNGEQQSLNELAQKEKH